MIDLAKLSERLYHEAEHIADDQPNLPPGTKNDMLMAASVLEVAYEWYEAEQANLHHRGTEVKKTMAACIAAKRRLKQAIEGAG